MWPKTGWQTPEEFQYRGFQWCSAMQSLHHEQPQNHQRGVDPIVLTATGSCLRLFEERRR